MRLTDGRIAGNGTDAAGIPVATVAINGAANSAVLAAEILAVKYPLLQTECRPTSLKCGIRFFKRIKHYRKNQGGNIIMANYKEAGVDVEAGYEAVKLMRGHVQKTYRPEVMTDIGGFGSFSNWI